MGALKLLGAAILVAVVVGCESTPQHTTQSTVAPQTEVVQTAVVPVAKQVDDSDQVWRVTLPELAKGHANKVQLGWYAGSFLRKLDPPVKDFAKKMHDEQKKLGERLEAWAKGHNISLKFSFGDAATGKAREALEKDDGDIIKGDNNTDFQRDMLIDMQSDYDWQRHLIATLLPMAKDPELKAYLSDSLKFHNEQFEEIRQLLKHYQWQK